MSRNLCSPVPPYPPTTIQRKGLGLGPQNRGRCGIFFNPPEGGYPLPSIPFPSPSPSSFPTSPSIHHFHHHSSHPPSLSLFSPISSNNAGNSTAKSRLFPHNNAGNRTRIRTAKSQALRSAPFPSQHGYDAPRSPVYSL